jgi:hypothetical protein
MFDHITRFFPFAQFTIITSPDKQDTNVGPRIQGRTGAVIILKKSHLTGRQECSVMHMTHAVRQNGSEF